MSPTQPPTTSSDSSSRPPARSSEGAVSQSEVVVLGEKTGGDGGKLPLVDDSYDWIRKANLPPDRSLRQEAAELTLKACRDRGYRLDGQRVSLSEVEAMVRGTRFVSAGDPPEASSAASAGPKFSRHKPGLLIPVALEQSKAGGRVVAVNAASAYSLGGGFYRGGRHALEESIFMQSTLSQSLEEAQRLKQPGQCHIPLKGVVLSPKVEVFRAGTAEGYPFLPARTVLTAIVSMAAPNCNPRMRDAPVDKPASEKEYRRLLLQKWLATLRACQLAGADVLVAPDVGCGVYMNDPAAVGGALGEALRTGPSAGLREVHLVGMSAFADAVEDAFEGPSVDSVGEGLCGPLTPNVCGKPTCS